MLPGIRSGLLIGKRQSRASLVNAFSGSASPMTVSGIQAGDVLIWCAGNSSGSIPGVPTGFTNLANGAATYGYRLAYKIAVGGETSISWTIPANGILLQFRGSSGPGAVASVASGNSGTTTLNSVSLQDGSGASKVASFILANTTSTLPTDEISAAVQGFNLGLYTPIGQTSFLSRTSSLGASLAWVTLSVEIKSP